MKTLLLATNNENKVKEIKEILGNLDINVISLKEAGINVEVEEDANTFMGNAFNKAATIFNLVKNKGYMVLADDSGLAVEALGGAPGVFSARFAGEHGNTKKNNEKLLKLMKDVENREAKFLCAMAMIINRNNIIRVQGEVKGLIDYEEKGANGFGYDPLFYIPEYNKTFAEMDSDTKNLISHRRDALNKLEKEVRQYLQGE